MWGFYLKNFVLARTFFHLLPVQIPLSNGRYPSTCETTRTCHGEMSGYWRPCDIADWPPKRHEPMEVPAERIRSGTFPSSFWLQKVETNLYQSIFVDNSVYKVVIKCTIVYTNVYKYRLKPGKNTRCFTRNTRLGVFFVDKAKFLLKVLFLP